MNWLIKLLGGYTKQEFYKQINIINTNEAEVKRIFYLINNQREKLQGALVSLFELYGHGPIKCYDLACYYSKELTKE